MRTFNCKIRFAADYLQARFTEINKEQLKKATSAGGIGKFNDPDTFLYQDKSGIYIPAIHLKGAIDGVGMKIKLKGRTTAKLLAKACIFVKPSKIYLDRKQRLGEIKSYVKRKDGNRVPICHPIVCEEGEEIEFKLETTDDEWQDEVFKKILIKAGQLAGIGGRRPQWGRFEVIKFEKEK